ncbi:hypothetical protein [Rhodopila sp.]|uniref:hypothetical protein n=1 Tax=Rhodopila sp. TaxID=2480087 RepID=UPI003D0F69C2
MKKVSSTRSARVKRSIVDGDLRNTRPLRVPGATITAWPQVVDADPASLAAEPVTGPTVAGGRSTVGSGVGPGEENPVAEPRPRAVLLSDGTRITFDTTKQFDND